jgi:DNA adenine methylase
MKTPINYYGGKTMLVKDILPLIPQHTVYTEVFFGGGAVFFAKEPAKIEFINDINKMVVNFYKVAKKQFPQLKSEIETTLHSEEQYLEARKIYFDAEKHNIQANDVLRAWALFVLSQQTFMSILDASWKYNRNRSFANTFQNKKTMFDETYVKRLESTSVFCRDALRVLENTDCEDAFHFIDPPYFNADMGHYGGYTENDFENLLKLSENLKGKFMITSYDSEILKRYAEKNNWHQIFKTMPLSASPKAGATKTEVFTMNYKL